MSKANGQIVKANTQALVTYRVSERLFSPFDTRVTGQLCKGGRLVRISAVRGLTRRQTTIRPRWRSRLIYSMSFRLVVIMSCKEKS